ncbi:hypothetical protein Clacol_007704 [Clathrus columnatus]|uniref:Uncharacterized protein n=1 Tax=Clathrus columnatus TaxID=1419009 RepID=A0AAV5ANF4_9AGAM|nr:hypothetical protein Clacol_007704 [Clathrus columnatus]
MGIFGPVISLVACRADFPDDEAWAGFMPRRGNSLDIEAYNLPRLRYSSSVSVKSNTCSGSRSSYESARPSLSRSKSLLSKASASSRSSWSQSKIETVRNLGSLRRRKMEKKLKEEWELRTPEQVQMEREIEKRRQRELAKEIEQEERRAFLGMWSDLQPSVVPAVRTARLGSEGRIRFSESEETDSLEAESRTTTVIVVLQY